MKTFPCPTPPGPAPHKENVMGDDLRQRYAYALSQHDPRVTSSSLTAAVDAVMAVRDAIADRDAERAEAAERRLAEAAKLAGELEDWHENRHGEWPKRLGARIIADLRRILDADLDRVHAETGEADA